MKNLPFKLHLALYLANKTEHKVPSISGSDEMMVEISRPTQKWDLSGRVAVLVSRVNFKGLRPKIVSPLLNASCWMKTMHACKTKILICRISNAPGEH